MTDIVDRIDETLEYYSAGIDETLAVAIPQGGPVVVGLRAAEMLRAFEGLADAVEALTPPLEQLCETFRSTFALLDAERKRAGRVRRLHAAYPRRWRKR